MTFLKIPRALFSCSTKDLRLYCAYLNFKVMALDDSHGGIIKKYKGKVRGACIAQHHYYDYWLKKLIDRRWIIDNGDHVQVIAYPAVWRMMGVNQTWDRRSKKYKFHYNKILIEDLSLERKKYFKEIMDVLLRRIAGNKVRQIKWRLSQKASNIDQTETALSSSRVARLFGLRSRTSGARYRKILFCVIDEPLQRIETDFGYRYKCKRIAL